jgi:hypothetical protein
MYRHTKAYYEHLHIHRQSHIHSHTCMGMYVNTGSQADTQTMRMWNLTPWEQKCSQSTGLTNICSTLTFIWRAEAKSAFLDLFYSSFLYTFPSGKIYWLKLAFSYQTLSVLKFMPQSCPSWRQPLKMLQPALPISDQYDMCYHSVCLIILY